MNNLLPDYGRVVTALAHYLGLRFTPDHPDLGSPVGRSVRAVTEHHFAGRVAERDLELFRLAFLAQDLHRIATNRPDIHKTFRKRVKRARTDDNFYGLRFEIKIASTLIKHGLPFTMPEKPDFMITDDGMNAGIECGSARIIAAKTGDLSYKIQQELQDKTQKPYASRKTALAIDITNLAFNGLGRSSISGFQDLKPAIARHLSHSGFGSVLLYIYMTNPTLDRYESNHIRVDAQGADPRLIKLLDVIAPISRHRVDKFTIAEEG
jgi:hypothetical protein